MHSVLFFPHSFFSLSLSLSLSFPPPPPSSPLPLSPPGHSPSPYVMYKFYTFPDHDTPILPHSTDPTFNNSKLFPVSMDTHLDSYLKKEVIPTIQLHVYS